MNAEKALRRALTDAFAEAMATANIGNIQSQDWASVTFTGMRHEVWLRVSGSGTDALIAGIGEREFDLPGHILIDIVATEISHDGEDRLVTMEALTVVTD